MTLNNVIKSIVLANAPHELAYTAFLYVSPNGDNSDGSSWEKAYNTIAAAVTAASADPEDFTLIMIAKGTYTIAAQIEVTKHVELRGVSKYLTKIINTIDIVGPPITSALFLNADGICISNMTFEDTAAILGNSLDIMFGTKIGIVVDHCIFRGLGADGLFIIPNDIAFGGTNLSVNALIQNCEFYGTGTAYSGVNVCGVNTHIVNCLFKKVNRGIVGNATSTGIIIDSCQFYEINDSAYNNSGNTDLVIISNCDFKNTLEATEAMIYTHGDSFLLQFSNNRIQSFLQQVPPATSEVSVPTNAAANTYGVQTDIILHAGISTYKIVGILATNPSVADSYFIQLYLNNAGTTRMLINELPLHTDGSITPIELEEWIYPGNLYDLCAKVKSLLGNETIDIALIVRTLNQ